MQEERASGVRVGFAGRLADTQMRNLVLLLLLSTLQLTIAFLPSTHLRSDRFTERFVDRRVCSPFAKSTEFLQPGGRFSTRKSCNIKGSTMSVGSQQDKRVVIVGAGPAGLAVAHFLLQRNEGYDITVVDSRADPRESLDASIRSYSLGLGVRGRTALKQLPEYVWQGVRERGVECDRSVAPTRSPLSPDAKLNPSASLL